MTRRTHVLGCEIDSVTMTEALERAEDVIEQRGYVQHMAVNAAKLVAAARDARLRDAIAASELVTADGQAVVWASRLLGDPLPERVAGIDLMNALLARAAERGWRVFLLGARRTVLDEAAKRIRERDGRIRIAGCRDGYFTADEEPAVVSDIAAAQADILFVGMSSPKKELFLRAHGRSLGIPFVMGVGGAFDILAGKTRRAPLLLQRLGLEWLFRLVQEPRRLFRRYAETNLRFLALVLAERLRRHTTA
jgi:N-acetylglucosaminyldiphosphoundecaprenol N-acetyl-beta-D-mannosaminyltransferase